MSVNDYLETITYLKETGNYRIINTIASKTPFFNVWHDNNITNMIIEYGLDATDDEGVGILEFSLANFDDFLKSDHDFSDFSENEIAILNNIKNEFNSSKYGLLTFDCY